MAAGRLKFYGWGREGEGLSPEEERIALARYAQLFGNAEFPTVPVAREADIALSQPAIGRLPASLQPFCSTDRYERLLHTYGKSFPDTVRGMAGDFAGAPDII